MVSPATTEGIMQSPVGGGWLVTKTNSTTLLLKGQELKLDQMLLRSAMRVVNLSYRAAVGTSLSRSRFRHSKSELQMSLLNSRQRGNTMVPHEDSKKQFFFLLDLTIEPSQCICPCPNSVVPCLVGAIN
jgi:hypothetical protein